MKTKITVKAGAVLLCLCLLVGLLPMTAFATPSPPNTKIVSQYNNPVIAGGSDSAVYAATVTNSSGYRIFYVYSADIVHNTVLFTKLKTALGEPYAALIPDIDDATETGLFVYSTSDGSTVLQTAADWTNPADVADKVVPGGGTIGTPQDAELDITDISVTNSADDIINELGETVSLSSGTNRIEAATSAFTSGPYYVLENGVLVEKYEIRQVMHVAKVYSQSCNKTTSGVSVVATKIRAINFLDGGSSTVYVNEAKSSGAGSESIKYIYSQDIIRAQTILDGLTDIVPNGYASLVPAPAEAVGIAESTSGTPTGDWASAEHVAQNVIAGSGTITNTTNAIDASAATQDFSETVLKEQLEAENYAAWQRREAEKEANWNAREQELHEADPSYEIKPYVSSGYLPIDFTGTTFGAPPTRNANEFLARIGTSLSGPFFYVEDGVTRVAYDIELTCHRVTVNSQTSDKAVPFPPVTLPVSTIETAADENYVLRPGLTAAFTPNTAVTAGTLGEYDGLKIDYYNPMVNPTELDDGYTKLAEYHVQFPVAEYAENTLSGTITVPLPRGYDGATAKIVGGESAVSSTAATVTFPITLDVGSGTASKVGILIEYKEAAPTTYTLTVNLNGGNGGNVSGDYAEGAAIDINAGTRPSYSFNGWTSSNGGSFANPNSASTTFTMPGNATTITAHWSYNGGGGGGSSYDYYTITASAGTGGSIAPSGSVSIREGRDKSFTITPDSGYVISDVLADGVSVKNKLLSNTYTFENVQKSHTIKATFIKESSVNPNTGGHPFTDVKESDWFFNDVMFVYDKGLMVGTSDTTFSPYDTTTRAMVATTIWRMEGEPKATGANGFTDVENGKWYAEAITWAAENGIAKGYGGGLFGANEPVTREQLAGFFYNYAKYKGYDTTITGSIEKFTDKGDISDWAVDAVKWAIGYGLMEGKTGDTLDPNGNATRAEFAAMLHRFIEKNN